MSNSNQENIVYSGLSYMRFCSNNKSIIEKPETEYIGCIFCKRKYRNTINIFYLNTDAACNQCYIDAVVPWQSIPGDNDSQKYLQLQRWYNEGFNVD